MPKLSAQELAESYGFAYSFFQSDPSLKKLIQDAVSGTWTADKFTAELKNTKWFKTHSESYRQWTLLSKTDPATANKRMAETIAQMRDAAGQMGAVLTTPSLHKLATNALAFGWNESQIRDQLAGYVRAYNGVFQGQAGTSVDEMRQMAWRNGINIGNGTLQGWAQAVARGDQNMDFYKTHIRQMAKSVAPSYAEDLDAGMDLYDIANPYIQAKAKILEMNPADIDLFDKDVRGALSSKGQDGKPASKTLWQFENDMRQNPAWLKTKGAQDSTMATASKVLRDFGFTGS